jgi:DNA-binding CsgD family transcriptional regulator
MAPFSTPATRPNTFGFPAEEVVGRSGFDFLHPEDLADSVRLLEAVQRPGAIIPEDLADSVRLLEAVQRPGAIISGEQRVRRRDGSWRWVEWTAENRLQDPDVGAIVVNARDVTDRKRMERELAGHATLAREILSSLTAREADILALLAEDLSGPQIAERLTISVRTVESHLANAYRKLGVRTRTEAVSEYARLERALERVMLEAPSEGPSDNRT